MTSNHLQRLSVKIWILSISFILMFSIAAHAIPPHFEYPLLWNKYLSIMSPQHASQHQKHSLSKRHPSDPKLRGIDDKLSNLHRIIHSKKQHPGIRRRQIRFIQKHLQQLPQTTIQQFDKRAQDLSLQSLQQIKQFLRQHLDQLSLASDYKQKQQRLQYLLPLQLYLEKGKIVLMPRKQLLERFGLKLVCVMQSTSKFGSKQWSKNIQDSWQSYEKISDTVKLLEQAIITQQRGVRYRMLVHYFKLSKILRCRVIASFYWQSQADLLKQFKVTEDQYKAPIIDSSEEIDYINEKQLETLRDISRLTILMKQRNRLQQLKDQLGKQSRFDQEAKLKWLQNLINQMVQRIQPQLNEAYKNGLKVKQMKLQISGKFHRKSKIHLIPITYDIDKMRHRFINYIGRLKIRDYFKLSKHLNTQNVFSASYQSVRFFLQTMGKQMENLIVILETSKIKYKPKKSKQQDIALINSLEIKPNEKPFTSTLYRVSKLFDRIFQEGVIGQDLRQLGNSFNEYFSLLGKNKQSLLTYKQFFCYYGYPKGYVLQKNNLSTTVIKKSERERIQSPFRLIRLIVIGCQRRKTMKLRQNQRGL